MLSSSTQIGQPIEKLFHYNQLAVFINKLLEGWQYPDNDSPFHIILSICYAARTVDYTKNHIAEANNLNFKETFAFKFLTALQDQLHNRDCFNEIILKAYTGAVSFNESTGDLVVQTEEEIQKEREKTNLEKEQEKLEQEIGNYTDISEAPNELIEKHEKLIEKRKSC